MVKALRIWRKLQFLTYFVESNNFDFQKINSAQYTFNLGYNPDYKTSRLTPADLMGKSFQNASFSSTTSNAIWVSIGDLSASPSLSSSPDLGPDEIGGLQEIFTFSQIYNKHDFIENRQEWLSTWN